MIRRLPPFVKRARPGSPIRTPDPYPRPERHRMTDTQLELQHMRPLRADARRNYDKLVTAAREVFTAQGTSAPLEDVAARAGVGIGTLYRRFPTRQALLEAVYLEEVQAIAAAAEELSDLEPWEALTQWLHRYVGFAATKRALTEALLEAAPESDAPRSSTPATR
jgi:AcrR family transcriptional regulator